MTEVKQHTTAIELTQTDEDPQADFQRMRVEVHSGGNGHYVTVITTRWSCDVDELRRLCDRMETMVREADVAWNEEKPSDT